MLISYKLLKKYVDLEGISLNEISNRLTFAGLEVEEIHKMAMGTNLVIGKIIKISDIEGSDHLHLLDVDLGEKYGITQIVCGAPNVKKDMKVIVARVGAKLKDGEIKEANIKGIPSHGMCCSLLELGVDTKYLNDEQINGIEELDKDAPIGEEKVLEYLNLDDEIFDIKILPNRPDCMAFLNVAKEVAALFEREFRPLKIEHIEGNATNLKVGSLTEQCPQFAGRIIRNIKVQESPRWLKDVLRSFGVRSINNIVDIGNYVMMMTGQPLHMYDLDLLDNSSLIVKDDFSGNFLALDEKEYELQKGDIVVTSNSKVMCLGGIMGSKASMTNNETKNLVIESATFSSTRIRRSSIRLNLISESSQRFSKGINKDQLSFVMDLTTSLIIDLAGTKEVEKVVNYDVLLHEPKIIRTSVTYINKRLGTEFSYIEICNALRKLGFKVNRYFYALEVIVPPYRIDIDGEADLSEEVIRYLGFDRINSTLPSLETTLGALTDSQKKERLIEDFLINRGLYEALTYTLIRKEEINYFSYLNNDDVYVLLHPLTDAHEVVRRNLLHSLLLSASYNISRQEKDIPFFEISDIFTRNGSEKHLAIVLVGEDKYRHELSKRPYDFYYVKGYLESIMKILGIEQSRYQIKKITQTNKEELHPGKSAMCLVDGKMIAVLGELHPLMYKKYGFGKTHAAVLEMNLSLFDQIKTSQIKSIPPSKYPSVKRDLALLVKKDIESSTIIKTIKLASNKLVNDVNVFDIYEGEGIADGYKSLAVQITYSSNDHTLSEKEIADVEHEIKNVLYQKLGITLRT